MKTKHSFNSRPATQWLQANVLCLLTAAVCLSSHAQSTAFTYQGRLEDGGSPASGNYDLRLALFNAVTAGTQQGALLTNAATAVSNGLFTVTLDFGTGIFTGADRWLEIGVRSNGPGAFTALTPRQPVTPTPYATFAKNVSATGITGTMPSSALFGIYSGPLTFNNGANSFSGSFYGQFFGASFTGGYFSGDGSGLLNLNASQITEGDFPASSLENAWRIIGNSGTTGTNFIGTTDNQALEFRVNNLRGFRIEPDPRPDNNAANIIGGHPLNRIEQPNSGGSIIAGGGGGGGGENIIRSNSSGAFIGAGSLNALGPNASDALITGGKGNRASSYAAVIGGGFGNILQTNSAYSTIAGGAQNSLESESATIGGGVGNVNKGYAATIAGGWFNTATNNGAFVGGGGQNVAHGFNSVVVGGAGNFANEQNAVIGGGSYNTNRAAAATIAGGILNQIGVNAFNSTIGGGSFNVIRTNSPHGTIPGGEFNAATNHAFAAGRQAKANHTGAFVWSDSTGADFSSAVNNEFAVRASGGVRFVTSGAGFTLNGQPVLTSSSTNALTLNNPANVFAGNGSGLTGVNATTLDGLDSANFWQLGGNAGTTAGVNFLGTTDNQPVEIKVNGQRALRLEPTVTAGSVNLIGGSPKNSVSPGVEAATIAGGGIASFPNTITASFATIGGGTFNTVSGGWSTIGGGRDNSVAGGHSTVAGGLLNTIQTGADFAAIGGGVQNTIQSNSIYSTISGGNNNTIRTNYPGGTIGGGLQNIVGSQEGTVAGGAFNSALGFSSTIGGGGANTTSGEWSTVAGGRLNALTNAYYASIGGGLYNAIQTNANYATIGGGGSNTVLPYAHFATIPGGRFNSATNYAFAAGNRAKAHHPGAFVWADSTDADFTSTGNNQFLIRATGNVGINTPNPVSPLHVAGDTRVEGMVQLGSGTGTAQTPDKPLLLRRVRSTASAVGQVVARTDRLTLERDGTSAGWRIVNSASPGNTTIAATGITAAGAPVNSVLFLSSSAASGTNVLFSDAQNVISFRCSFGDSYTPNHMTEVSLTRYQSDLYWTGTATSTFNQ